MKEAKMLAIDLDTEIDIKSTIATYRSGRNSRDKKLVVVDGASVSSIRIERDLFVLLPFIVSGTRARGPGTSVGRLGNGNTGLSGEGRTSGLNLVESALFNKKKDRTKG